LPALNNGGPEPLTQLTGNKAEKEKALEKSDLRKGNFCRYHPRERIRQE
jgi:hypothetical protein